MTNYWASKLAISYLMRDKMAIKDLMIIINVHRRIFELAVFLSITPPMIGVIGVLLGINLSEPTGIQFPLSLSFIFWINCALSIHLSILLPSGP